MDQCVWSPHTARKTDKLERIQRRGTKFILGKRNFTYDERLKCLKLLSLEKRRYLFDVTFLYEALNGYLNVDLSPFLNFYSQDDPYRFRHVDDYSLKTILLELLTLNTLILIELLKCGISSP